MGTRRKTDPVYRVFFSIILVTAVYQGTLFTFEPSGFWIVDNANKFLQMEAFIDNHNNEGRNEIGGTTFLFIGLVRKLIPLSSTTP